MDLIKPSATIEAITPDALKLIERAGRTCYKSEDKITIISAGNFAGMIIKRGHETVLEHASATVRFICDRGVSHELVRHRIASFSQESTRYVNYGNADHIGFIIPEWCNLPEGEVILRQYDELLPPDREWLEAMSHAEWHYQQLIVMGWRPEQARSVLPNSLKTEIVMTANFREWRHFFSLRDAAPAHPQMRELCGPLHEAFRQAVPIIFD